MILSPTDSGFHKHNMGLAGAVRSSTALGLRQTAWRAGERTQWQQVRCIAGADLATQAREQRKAMRRKQDQDMMGGEDLQNEIILPGKSANYDLPIVRGYNMS